MTLSFTTEEKIAFLRKHNYTVQEEKIMMYYSAYHNSVDEEEKLVWAVYSRGKPFCKPGGGNFRKSEWVDLAFQVVLNKRLLLI